MSLQIQAVATCDSCGERCVHADRLGATPTKTFEENARTALAVAGWTLEPETLCPDCGRFRVSHGG